MQTRRLRYVVEDYALFIPAYILFLCLAVFANIAFAAYDALAWSMRKTHCGKTHCGKIMGMK